MFTCIDCKLEFDGPRQRRRCHECRRTWARRRTVRTLERGETIPDAPTRRYPREHGYVELRWTVAPMTEVRAYEHQIVDGRMTLAEQVHHRNHQRDDNAPDNLLHTTCAKHHAEHRADWWSEAAKLYASGIGTYRIGKYVGANPASVYRALVKMGVEMRPQRGGRYHRSSPDHETTDHGGSIDQ